MVAPAIAALAAKKRKNDAETGLSALKNDIFVQRWSKVVGTGKNRHVVEREIHVNPTSLAIGAAGTLAVGAAGVLAAGAGMYLMGIDPKLTKSNETHVKYKTVTTTTEISEPDYEYCKANYDVGTPMYTACLLATTVIEAKQSTVLYKGAIPIKRWDGGITDWEWEKVLPGEDAALYLSHTTTSEYLQTGPDSKVTTIYWDIIIGKPSIDWTVEPRERKPWIGLDFGGIF